MATLCYQNNSIIDIRLPFYEQLRPNLKTSHKCNERRPRHKMSIFAFVILFAFENKHWFCIQCKILYLCDFLKMGFLEVLTFSL